MKKPDFYKAFSKKEIVKHSDKPVKYSESNHYWMFKTGEVIYKIKKKNNLQLTQQIEHVLLLEMLNQTRSHSPELEMELLSLTKNEAGKYQLVDFKLNNPEHQYFVFKMNQLSESYFLSSMIQREKVKEQHIKDLVDFLIQFHENSDVQSSKEFGTADPILNKLEDLMYQSKKYLNKTLTQATLDMTHRPLEKFIQDNKKLISKRLKKGKIRSVHGCLIPSKIHIYKGKVQLLPMNVAFLNDRFKDVAADLADLLVELQMHDLGEFSNQFLEYYSTKSKDKDLKQITTFYQAMKCFQRGLEQSVLSDQKEADEAETHIEQAKLYYQKAVEIVREL